MSARDQPQRAFGDWLRQRRRELDLTRDELARQVGCSVVTLRKLETEERRPSKAMAERLAEVLSLAPDDRPTFLRFARGDPFAAPLGSVHSDLQGINTSAGLPSLPSGTLTLLFTDLEGSTQTLQQTGAGYAELLNQMRTIQRVAFAHWNGREVDTQGDAFFVAFSRASDAIYAAVEAQRALAGHAWPPGIAMKVRMGLHTGEPELGPAGYTGLDVHRAARIGAAAHGGQVLLSQTTHDLLSDSDLPDGVSLLDMGEHLLKDLRRSRRLYQLLIAGLPADFPKLKSLDAPRHNLPIQLTSFIGRDREVEAVRQSVRSARLVTLTGVGGAGKTRLALQAASGLLDQFPDGIWMIELASLADPALVPETAAGVLSLKEQAGRPILATLLDHLRGQTVLLIMDNCEHLVDACAQFAATLLTGCVNLRLLITSREAFGIPGETLFGVPPLSSPDAHNLPPAGDLTDYDAVRLFVERAGAVLPGFALTSENAPAVARICRQLDGIPLAIELAAARVRVLEVEQIAGRLGDRFRLLTGGRRATLPRHQTLQALIDWSYDLLTPPERVLLQRLAVFVGGWNLAAAEAACADEAEGGRLTDEAIRLSDVFELLSQLVNKSLVAVERQAGQEARYRLLDTIRHYALAKLAGSGEADAVWRRLVEYYIELVKASGLADRTASFLDPYSVLEPERDNLRAALAWCRSAAGAEELGLRLAVAVMDSWIGHGYWQEAQAFLAGALARATTVADAQARARALYGLGHLAHNQANYAEASAYLLESLSLSREHNDVRATGATLVMFGDLAMEQDDLVLASARIDEARALFQRVNDREGLGAAINSQAELAVAQGDGVRAAALFEESLAVVSEPMKPIYRPWMLLGLGEAAQLRGDYEEAQRRYSESLVFFRQGQQSKLGQPWAVYGLGEAALGLGNAAVAAQRFADALKLFRDEGDRGAISFCLTGLGCAAAMGEEPERAVRLWGAAEALREAIGSRRSPTSRSIRERLMATAREQLGDETFGALWAEGGRMTMEQAVVLGLSS